MASRPALAVLKAGGAAADQYMMVPGSPDQAERFGGAGEAMDAVSRLLRAAGEALGPQEVEERLVREARGFFRVRGVALVSVAELEGWVEVGAMDPPGSPPGELLALSDLGQVAGLLEDTGEPLRIAGEEAGALARALGAGEATVALLLPLRLAPSAGHVLVLLDDRERQLSGAELEVARAFAAAAAAALAQLQLAADRAGRNAREAALARAAKSLNESLDPARVLSRICEEAVRILDADKATVYIGNAEDGLRIEAVYGDAPELIGATVAPGEGLVGKCVVADEPMLTNDYQRLPRVPDLPQLRALRSCLAVPMHWDGELRGAVTVGYHRPRLVTRDELGVLEAFAELAAAACRNARAHAGLAIAARTDALTGCLNHAALHDALERELERCRRTGHRLSLAIVDLDHFKQVNEGHGHLAGDEVLHNVGRGLRYAVRPYDLVARYGGDEFAIVAIDAGEREAAEVATRALEGIASAVAEIELAAAADAGGATAGVAEWRTGETPTGLIARADRALLYGKQRGARGVAVCAGDLPDDFLPATRDTAGARSFEAPDDVWPDRAREQTERLRKRTRQLVLANALATRVSAMTEPREIAEAAVEEMQSAFGYVLCAIFRVREDGFVESVAGSGPAADRLVGGRWSQPREAGLIGRCLRERRPVVSGDVRSESDYRLIAKMAEVRSELVVPLWVGGDLWGAIDVEAVEPNAFDGDDVRLLQTVSEQVGSALRSATLYEQLERAHLSTAEALAGALEDHEPPRAGRATWVVETAQAVGKRLGMSADDLRALRLGSILHDIGKSAVPEAILEKRGELTSEERQEVQRHPIVAERILAPIDSLTEVRRLVRHEHERWDGLGYPDGLAGDEIPLGSRVILACDAFDAMLSDRPHRPAMTEREARAELRRCAGTQFDPRVVDALTEVIDERGTGAPYGATVSRVR